MAYAQRTTKKVYLTDPKYWIEIYTSGLRYGDVKNFAAISEDETAKADLTLKSLIASWNLDGEDNHILPLTQENIDLLSSADATLVLNAINDALTPDDDAKKNSSSQSPAPSPVGTPPLRRN